MPTAHIDDIDLAYKLSGSGPRVLFLNGSGATLERSAPLLGLFGTDIELLAFDQRGLGGSGPAPGPYDMARCASDALALMDAVGWERARVLGVSFGGMVAQELAVTAPYRVERLALLCTSSGGAGGSSYPLHQLESLPVDQRAATRAGLIDDRFDEAWLSNHPGDRGLVDLLARSDDDRPAEDTTSGIGSMPSPVRPSSPAGAMTRSPPWPTARPSPLRSPGPNSTPTKAATPSSSRTERPCPRSWGF